MCRRLLAFCDKDEVNETLHGAMGFHRMAQWQLAMDAIDIAPADTFAFQNTTDFQLCDDFLNRTFGYADGLHHIPQPHSRVFGKA